MSFLKYKDYIEEGDTVILYVNPQCMYPVIVKAKKLNKQNEEIENTFQTSFGCLKVESLIGKQFGSKVILTKGSDKGWAHVLHPNAELWTMTLPHRTQIIYTPDISMILFQLDLKPGRNVIEAGTGSGSLTHALARAVNPSGQVYSFDFHETRVSKAKQEFEDHGLGNVVTVCQRDVCADGFGDDTISVIDAVFLDLPLPWEAVLHSVKCFKNEGGRLASFSPCIEQVQKTCSCLRSLGFAEINTLECLQKEYSVVHRTLPTLSLSLSSEVTEEQETQNEKFLACLAPLTMPGHTGYLTVATLPPSWCRLSPMKLISPPSTENGEADVLEVDGDVSKEDINAKRLSFHTRLFRYTI